MILADASTTLSTTPIIDILAPYISIIVQAAVIGLLTWAATKFSQQTGVQVSTANLDRLKSAAATEAGVLVASAEDNLKGKSINVGSPEVVAAAQRIEAALPDTMKAAGATPETLQKFVAGEVGKLQSASPPPAIVQADTAKVSLEK